MKPSVTKTWVMALAAAALAFACSEERLTSGEGGGAGQPVVIQLNPATRAGGYLLGGSAADNATASMRVLVYETRTGLLEWNYPLDLGASGTPPHRIEVKTGVYDFVFIANEGSDGGLAAKLADEANYNTLAKLRALTIDRSAFGTEKPIPMVAHYDAVEVVDDRSVRYTDPYTGADESVTAAVWPVVMERAGVCVSMSVWLTDGQYAAWQAGEHAGQIGIANIPVSAFLLPGTDNGASQPSTPVYEWFDATDEMDWESAYPTLPEEEEPPTGTRAVYCRVILPELMFTPNTDESKALVLRMDIGDAMTGVISAPADEDFGYTLPRGTWLHLSGVTVDNGIVMQARVLPWIEATPDDDPIPGQYSLTVDKDLVVLPYEASEAAVLAVTDYPTGWTIERNELAALGIAVTKEDDTHVAISAAEGMARRGTFVVRAGNLSKTITVEQMPGTEDIVDMPANVNTYVGAFWKKTQTGERLIRVVRPDDGSLDGPWMATVLSGEEWIVLDTEMTSDPNVGWRRDVTPQESLVQNGNDAGFDAAHQVTGNLTEVGGTLDNDHRAIYFRIGLKSTLPVSGRPRYGVVLLSCKTVSGTYTSRIWIRQGEDADYMMHFNDPDIGTDERNRTHTVRFSPYNVTAAAMTDANQYIPLGGVNGGAHVAYPSQAGALFQFASATNPRYAYHPTLNPKEVIAGWDTSTATTWNAAEHETCPPNYRRPTSGGSRFTSELFMSLMADISTPDEAYENPNSAWGYYADGFFDRRDIEMQESSTTAGNPFATPYSAVATGTKDVAYVGRLFYNTVNGASLFFPASGMRRNDNGALQNAGSYGHYWTANVSGTENGRTISISQNDALPDPTPQNRSRGYSLRCVSTLNIW